MFCICSRPWTIAALKPTSARFDEILPAPGRVLALCAVPACDGLSVLEVGRDLHAHLGRAALARLEMSLRCLCGGRRGTFEPWPEGLPPPSERGRLFLFVV